MNIDGCYNPATHKVVPKDAMVLDLDPTVAVQEFGARRNEFQRLVDMLRETADEFFVPDAAALARKVANQIEAQTKPSISEPMGLGAVVVDSRGRNWVRFLRPGTSAPWLWSEAPEYVERLSVWSAIDVTEVLSEGVSDVAPDPS